MIPYHLSSNTFDDTCDMYLHKVGRPLRVVTEEASPVFLQRVVLEYVKEAVGTQLV